jgi:hypothetical protein
MTAPLRSRDPLADLRAEVARQRVEFERRLAALEQQQQQKTPSDSALLSAIALAVQGAVFSAKELVDHAAVDANLRAAIGPVSARRLGKRLRSLVETPIDGLVLHRVGRDGGGAIWSVVTVAADCHTAAGPSGRTHGLMGT